MSADLTRRGARALALATSALPVIADAYLLGLLAAAATPDRGVRRGRVATPPRHYLVLVPAHDEAEVLEPAVRALMTLDHPAANRTVVVVADNCTDTTATVARRAGATVFERHDPGRRGKGHALAWALDRAARELQYDAVAMVDADCVASPNLLSVLDERFAAGDDVVQVDYVVADPERSWSVGLRYAAFALMNSVRPRGKTRLGLSAGLLGTGMAFRRRVLDRHPWNAFSIVEDAEFHTNLVAAGYRVAFAPDAHVSSEMPASLAKSSDQQMRWEGGRGLTIRQSTAPLVRAGLRERDPVRLNAGVEPLVPPLSLLVALHLAAGAFALTVRAPRAAALAGLGLAGQVVFVTGGLLLVRAPAAVWRALLFAPALIAQKLWIYGRLAAGRTPKAFVRTARDG